MKLTCCRCLMILLMLARMRSSLCIFGTPLSESNGSYCLPLKAFNFFFFPVPYILCLFPSIFLCQDGWEINEQEVNYLMHFSCEKERKKEIS